MTELAADAETAPIVTATRAPPKGADAEEADGDDAYPPTMTATRVA